VVSLPKKQGVALPNRMNAARRLSSLRDRLDHNEALKEIYHAQMVDYIAKWQGEVAPVEDSTAMFYLPHQAVKNLKNGTTKLRIVFDASFHERRTLPERRPGNGAEIRARDSRDSITVEIASLSYCRRRYASVPKSGP